MASLLATLLPQKPWFTFLWINDTNEHIDANEHICESRNGLTDIGLTDIGNKFTVTKGCTTVG